MTAVRHSGPRYRHCERSAVMAKPMEAVQGADALIIVTECRHGVEGALKVSV